ncbi:uncharacterized protein RAG0_01625 [Rhynchosporium agropyri]|uniref:Uncharacterized protein n=1 Tax=Rhynchosporium agropyri TaxID=914238 RepID=A0A1E1JXQ9_9HELO|nr:uncharacterized protein RAG0_01625 [Rhynchosporium agropyri]
MLHMRRTGKHPVACDFGQPTHLQDKSNLSAVTMYLDIFSKQTMIMVMVKLTLSIRQVPYVKIRIGGSARSMAAIEVVQQDVHWLSPGYAALSAMTVVGATAGRIIEKYWISAWQSDWGCFVQRNHGSPHGTAGKKCVLDD